MTYQEFNKRVFDRYISKASGSFCILSMDTEELFSRVTLEDLHNFGLKLPWNLLLTEIDGIPQYFGLISLQCCAASLMQKDKSASQNAYQLRLVQLLGLTNEQELQSLFRGSDLSLPTQEILWQEAKAYLKDRLNLDLEIPSPTSHAGRFIQYPKSQCLLNIEDLKYFTKFFAQEFRVDENISFQFFSSRLNHHIRNIVISNHTRNILKDDKKSLLCLKQLFNYYNRWGGEVFDFQTKKTCFFGTVDQAIKTQKIIMIREKDSLNFYHNGSEPIPPSQLLHLPAYRYFYRQLVFFTELEDYTLEYEDSRFIYKDCLSYILLNKIAHPALYRYLMSNNREIENLTDQDILFQYLPSDETASSPLKVYLQREKAISLFGGLKITQAFSYLEGFGPNISGPSDFSVIYRNNRCDYDPQIARPGDYIVRVRDYRDVRFSIVGKNRNSIPIKAREIGWDFKSYSLSGEPYMEGCLIRTENYPSGSRTREWINANLTTAHKITLPTSNPLLKAISNFKKNEH